MNNQSVKKLQKPERLFSYWSSEPWLCVLITITGLTYNFGMLASPYFEGALIDGIEGGSSLQSIWLLVLYFLLAVLLTQVMRILKRYFVRHFASRTTYKMRSLLFNNILSTDYLDIQIVDPGTLLSRDIGDTKNAVEGMRKLTTEIFDTVFLFIFYAIFLFFYDWKMTLISLAFVVLAIVFAFLFRKAIFVSYRDSRAANADVSRKTYNFFDHAMLYRFYGRDVDNLQDYEKSLNQYEKKTVKASTLRDAMIPISNVIALLGLIPILIIGADHLANNDALFIAIPNIMKPTWTLGALSTYITTFVLLASKASRSVKLFGAIENGLASWNRIKGDIKPYEEAEPLLEVSKDDNLVLDHVSLSLNEETIFKDLSLTAQKGEVIGLSGSVASGKTALLKTLLGSFSYQGNISIFGKELSSYSLEEKNGTILYMGHHPELFTDSIKENVTLGDEANYEKALKEVSFDLDFEHMDKKEETLIGNEGTQLSGGQKQRISLSRSFLHHKGLVLLDDPFASLDSKTMNEILPYVKQEFKDSLVIISSSRLSFFPSLDNIVFLEKDKEPIVMKHDELIKKNLSYQELYLSEANHE